MNLDEASRLIKRGRLLELRHALDDGLDPNTQNENGWTLLTVAASYGDITIGKFLISRGADVNLRGGWSVEPLWQAAHGGHLPFVNLLLENGSIVDEQRHGELFRKWLVDASGLPQEKIRKIADLLRARLDIDLHNG